MKIHYSHGLCSYNELLPIHKTILSLLENIPTTVYVSKHPIDCTITIYNSGFYINNSLNYVLLITINNFQTDVNWDVSLEVKAINNFKIFHDPKIAPIYISFSDPKFIEKAQNIINCFSNEYLRMKVVDCVFETHNDENTLY